MVRKFQIFTLFCILLFPMTRLCVAVVVWMLQIVESRVRSVYSCIIQSARILVTIPSTFYHRIPISRGTAWHVALPTTRFRPFHRPFLVLLLKTLTVLLAVGHRT